MNACPLTSQNDGAQKVNPGHPGHSYFSLTVLIRHRHYKFYFSINRMKVSVDPTKKRSWALFGRCLRTKHVRSGAYRDFLNRMCSFVFHASYQFPDHALKFYARSNIASTANRVLSPGAPLKSNKAQSLNPVSNPYQIFRRCPRHLSALPTQVNWEVIHRRRRSEVSLIVMATSILLDRRIRDEERADAGPRLVF